MSDRPIRVQLSRKKGWRMPPNTIKVARPGKWGNEFRLGDHVRDYVGSEVVEAKLLDTPGAVVEWYEKRLLLAIEQYPQIMLSALDELRGKNLACWCALDAPCHADVLLRIANA